MSNLEDGLYEDDGLNGGVNEADTELAGGEDFGDEAPTEVDQAPEYDYLDLDDDTASKYVKVKVDGEDVSVPLNEALSGYSRTQDYTRKTQELAAQRQEAQDALRLSQAFGANPGLTVQVLANQAGMTVEQFLGMSPQQQQRVANDAQDDWDVDDYVDPADRQLTDSLKRVEALEQRIAQQDADRVLEQATSALKSQYGASHDDVVSVVGQAVRMRVGPEMFPMIFQSMQYQKTQAQAEAQAQSVQERQASEEQRRAAGRQASRVVGAGTGAAGSGVTTAPNPDKPMTIREALEAAFNDIE